MATETNLDIYKGSVFGPFTPTLARVIPDVLAYRTDRDLLRCGYYHPAAYDSYLAIRNVLVMGTVLSTMCWVIVVSDLPRFAWMAFIVGLVATLLAYAIPRVYLSLSGDRRADRIFSDIPDAMDTLVMGMTGGLSLEQSLTRTTVELKSNAPELAREFEIIGRQTLAASLEHAFLRFASRMDIDELKAMSDTIRHASEMGTPVSQLLQQHADQLRQIRLQRAQQRGNTVALKMLFPTIFCLAPAAFIVILSPPLLELRSFRDRENKSKGALSQESLSDNLKSRRPQAK
ncbi:MAG: type II secretion system F family protein [Pirellulaceae bacterium]|nr:type II secretion system F family protein [Pirellulaceae bacterium]